MKKWIITTAIIGTVSVALTALAMPPDGKGEGQRHGQRGGPGGGPEGGGRGIGLLVHHPEIAEKAGITDEQIEQIKDKAYETRRAQIPLQSELELAKMDLDKLVSAEQPDLTAIDAAIENVGRIETELAKLQIRQRLDVREILGDEALEKMKKFARRQMEKRRSHMDKDDGPRRFSKQDRKHSGGPRHGATPPAPEVEEVVED